ncbi:MAG: glycosyltransferase family 1 protein, partial [Actinobacteria bacterium]|nr:glycosyltransferase family 1 protein [Actinomycetota bacterium]
MNYVVQRYGEEVAGGAEGACRRLAEGVAAAGHDVSVLTTCALDSETWANHFPAGESEVNGVRVIRFTNISKRHPRFEAMSNKIRWDPDPSPDLQNEWVRRQGPESPALIEEIKSRAESPDLWVFYTYLYYPTLLGLPIVSEKALLHPALHDEWQARLPIVKETIRRSAALSMQTPEEWEWTVRFAGWPPSKVRMIGM